MSGLGRQLLDRPHALLPELEEGAEGGRTVGGAEFEGAVGGGDGWRITVSSQSAEEEAQGRSCDLHHDN